VTHNETQAAQDTHGELPAGIGPHEGREPVFLLAGTKHVAYFGDTQPDWLERFAREHCDSFAWVVWRQHWKDRPFYSHVLFRRSHVAWAEELISLVSTPATGWQVETERRIGTLLSYSQQEIDAWIRWIGSRKV
jgi:hypothetical protein